MEFGGIEGMASASAFEKSSSSFWACVVGVEVEGERGDGEGFGLGCSSSDIA
jgi:hypothetical protein